MKTSKASSSNVPNPPGTPQHRIPRQHYLSGEKVLQIHGFFIVSYPHILGACSNDSIILTPKLCVQIDSKILTSHTLRCPPKTRKAYHNTFRIRCRIFTSGRSASGMMQLQNAREHCSSQKSPKVSISFCPERRDFLYNLIKAFARPLHRHTRGRLGRTRRARVIPIGLRYQGLNNEADNDHTGREARPRSNRFALHSPWSPETSQ